MFYYCIFWACIIIHNNITAVWSVEGYKGTMGYMNITLLDDKNTIDNFLSVFCLVLIDDTKSDELKNLHMAAFFFFNPILRL